MPTSFARTWRCVDDHAVCSISDIIRRPYAVWPHHGSPDRPIALRCGIHLSRGIFRVYIPDRRSVRSRGTRDGGVADACSIAGISAPWRSVLGVGSCLMRSCCVGRRCLRVLSCTTTLGVGVRWNHDSRDGMRLLCMIPTSFVRIWCFVHEGLACTMYGVVRRLSADWRHHGSPDRPISLRCASHLSQGILLVCIPDRRSVRSRGTRDGGVAGECGNVGISAPYSEQREVFVTCTTAVPVVMRCSRCPRRSSISRPTTWLALSVRWAAKAA